MIQTSYGLKGAGTSKYVVVAPHAAGDDLYTRAIATKLAETLGGYAVINTKFVKPENSHARPDKSNVQNFNRLSWSRTKKRYLWAKKKPEMKQFYSDIKSYAELAREISSDDRAVVVYIHGMKDRSNLFSYLRPALGMDVGFGVKPYQGFLRGAVGRNRHPEAGKNTGVVRSRRREIRSMRDSFDREIQKSGYRFRAGIGKFPSWSRKNGIQYHAGTNDTSFQIEINKTLRKDTEKTAKIIADALLKTYQ